MRHGTTIGRLVELVDVGGGKVGLPAVSGKLLTDISGLPVGSIMQVLRHLKKFVPFKAKIFWAKPCWFLPHEISEIL